MFRGSVRRATLQTVRCSIPVQPATENAQQVRVSVNHYTQGTEGTHAPSIFLFITMQLLEKIDQN